MIDGINHLTSLTADMDRLIAFYQRVFDARVTLDLEEEELRHVFIQLGPNTVLHPFQVPGVDVPQGKMPMFGRGRLDHFAVNAASEADFYEIRRRVVELRAGDGLMADMGPALNFSYEDPDGAEHEVVWTRPDADFGEALKREDWTRYPYPKRPEAR